MIARARLSLAIALALPLLGLGYGWATTHAMAQRGIDWDVPVAGYDPRDLLRGHYISFRYQWPKLERPDEYYGQGRLCLKGRAPQIEQVTTFADGDEVVPADCATIIRPPLDQSGLGGGIYYVPQNRAASYEAKLRDPKLKGFMRIRVREDGLMRPVALRFEKVAVDTR